MNNYFSGSDWASGNAKKALPILVSFAESRRPTTYAGLSQIIFHDKNYAHPLMYALGRLGKALEFLSKEEFKKLGKIPPIQLLVCNQNTRRPGNKSLSFLGIRKSTADQMSKQELNSVVRVAHESIYSYTRWRGVLKAFGLEPLTLKLPAPETLLPTIDQIERRRAGEGTEHKRLKLFLAENPKKIGIGWHGTGRTEVLLLSGDRLDVSFRSNERWIAVEVKGKNSPEADLVRGIFQCLKYRIIMEAQIRYEAFSSGSHLQLALSKTILACGCAISSELREFAESFDIEIKSDLVVPKEFVPNKEMLLRSTVPTVPSLAMTTN